MQQNQDPCCSRVRPKTTDGWHKWISRKNFCSVKRAVGVQLGVRKQPIGGLLFIVGKYREGSRHPETYVAVGGSFLPQPGDQFVQHQDRTFSAKEVTARSLLSKNLRSIQIGPIQSSQLCLPGCIRSQRPQPRLLFFG